MAHIRANGIDIHYTVEGAGPPLIMLHGATSAAAEDWAAQRPLFRKAFRIYLVDARGHGGTKWDVRDGFTREAARSGLRVESWWTDRAGDFAVALLRTREERP